MKYFRIVKVDHPNYKYYIIQEKMFFNLFWITINYHGSFGSMKYDTSVDAQRRFQFIQHVSTKSKKEVVITYTIN